MDYKTLSNADLAAHMDSIVEEIRCRADFASEIEKVEGLLPDEISLICGEAYEMKNVKDTLVLNHYGIPTEFQVAHKDYITRRTLVLVPKKICFFSPFNVEYQNKYPDSTMDKYISTIFIGGFHPLIKKFIAESEIDCHVSGEIVKIKRKAWALSYEEMNFAEYRYAPKEGRPLDLFKENENRKKNCDGVNRYYWLRTPHSNDTNRAWSVNTDGSATDYSVSSSFGVVPAFEI